IPVFAPVFPAVSEHVSVVPVPLATHPLSVAAVVVVPSGAIARVAPFAAPKPEPVSTMVLEGSPAFSAAAVVRLDDVMTGATEEGVVPTPTAPARSKPAPLSPAPLFRT